MTQVGKIIDSEQQLCYAHGIQLAVLDAVKALCRRDTNLIKAEAAVNFCIVTLKKQTSPLAKTLASALEKRMKERCALHAGVLQYLHNPAAASTDVFVIPSAGDMTKFIQRLLLRLDHDIHDCG
jgi:hypothetical protein